MKKPLLTRQECSMIRGMANYWNEVNEREDTSPLQSELADLYRRLGTRAVMDCKRLCRAGRQLLLRPRNKCFNNHTQYP